MLITIKISVNTAVFPVKRRQQQFFRLIALNAAFFFRLNAVNAAFLRLNNVNAAIFPVKGREHQTILVKRL